MEDGFSMKHYLSDRVFDGIRPVSPEERDRVMKNRERLIMKDKVQQLIEAKTLIDNEMIDVLRYLKDDTVDLDARWDVYVDMCKNNLLVNNNPYGDGYIESLGNKLTLYDDFHIDRNNTVQYVTFYTSILSRQLDQKSIDAWRKEVLASGHSSFRYDW